MCKYGINMITICSPNAPHGSKKYPNIILLTFTLYFLLDWFCVRMPICIESGSTCTYALSCDASHSFIYGSCINHPLTHQSFSESFLCLRSQSYLGKEHRFLSTKNKESELIGIGEFFGCTDCFLPTYGKKRRISSFFPAQACLCPIPVRSPSGEKTFLK